MHFSHSHAELDVAGREILEDEDAHYPALAQLLGRPRYIRQDHLGLSILFDGLTVTATPSQMHKYYWHTQVRARPLDVECFYAQVKCLGGCVLVWRDCRQEGQGKAVNLPVP